MLGDACGRVCARVAPARVGDAALADAGLRRRVGGRRDCGGFGPRRRGRPLARVRNEGGSRACRAAETRAGRAARRGRRAPAARRRIVGDPRGRPVGGVPPSVPRECLAAPCDPAGHGGDFEPRLGGPGGPVRVAVRGEPAARRVVEQPRHELPVGRPDALNPAIPLVRRPSVGGSPSPRISRVPTARHKASARSREGRWPCVSTDRNALAGSLASRAASVAVSPPSVSALFRTSISLSVAERSIVRFVSMVIRSSSFGG